MRPLRNAFSLIEIVLALGIISFALVGILALFPAAMSAARDSRQQTQSTFIVQQILGQLRSGPPTSTSFPTAFNPVSGGSTPVNLSASNQYYAVTDEDGKVISGGATAAPAGGLSGAFVANLTVQPVTSPTAGASKVTIDVCYPASAPAVGRRTNTFVTYLRNTGS